MESMESKCSLGCLVELALFEEDVPALLEVLRPRALRVRARLRLRASPLSSLPSEEQFSNASFRLKTNRKETQNSARNYGAPDRL